MWKKIKQFKKVWNIVNSKEVEDLETLIPQSELKNGETIWDYYERTSLPKQREKGDGKAVFIPLMTPGERDAYLKDQEPIWKKFNEKLKQIIK
jgi:hypothetical protein